MTFQEFCGQVEKLLNGTAAGKGYNATGPDSQNQLYEFVQRVSGGHQHAQGEIIYKIQRFAAKGNLEDIYKAAAWCFLIAKHSDLRRDSE